MYRNPVSYNPVISVFYHLHLLILATSYQYHQPLQPADTETSVKVSAPRPLDRKFQDCSAVGGSSIVEAASAVERGAAHSEW